MGQTLVVPDPLADLARLDGVPSALAAARDAVDLRSARSGSAFPDGRAARRRPAGRGRGECRVDRRPGALAARGGPGGRRSCLSLSRVIRVAPGQALARAHVLAASGDGRRTTRWDGSGRRPRWPTGCGAGRATQRTGGPTQAPALVLAAVAHAEIATVMPFGSARRPGRSRRRADGARSPPASIRRAASRLRRVTFGWSRSTSAASAATRRAASPECGTGWCTARRRWTRRSRVGAVLTVGQIRTEADNEP